MRSGRAQAQDARDVLLRDPRSHPHQHPPLRPGRRFHLEQQHTHRGSYAFTTKTEGDHKACFYKTTVDDPADLKHHKVRLDWKTGVAVMDYEDRAGEAREQSGRLARRAGG